MYKLKPLLLLPALIFCWQLPASAQQQPRPDAEAPMTRAQGDQILSELRKIRLLLREQLRAAKRPANNPQRPQTPSTARFKPGDRPAMGAENAPVVLVEFTDYHCPFCKRYHDSTYPALVKKYVDSGKLRYVSVDMPLPIHPQARDAAHATHCAGEQGQFWQLRDQLFDKSFNRKKVQQQVATLGMDVDRFNQCLQNKTYQSNIEKDLKLASQVGFGGTPSFVIGRLDNKGVLSGKTLVGAQPTANFEQAIEAALKQAGQ